jgi:uncharacterized membrane protein
MRDQFYAREDMKTSWLISGTLVIAYALFGHYASARPDEIGAWAILLAGAPILLVIFGAARASRLGLLLGVVAMSAMGLLAWLWPTFHNPTVWLYFLQHFGINAALALMFGRTLLDGHRPLVTVVAAMAHDEMSPELLRYTRQVTVAWTLFFVGNALASTLLFFFAPTELWSMFANILSMPLVGLMFLVENEVRKRTLPKRDQVGLLGTVRAVSAKFRR